jgi:hypothetical protein
LTFCCLFCLTTNYQASPLCITIMRRIRHVDSKLQSTTKDISKHLNVVHYRVTVCIHFNNHGFMEHDSTKKNLSPKQKNVDPNKVDCKNAPLLKGILFILFTIELFRFHVHKLCRDLMRLQADRNCN